MDNMRTTEEIWHEYEKGLRMDRYRLYEEALEHFLTARSYVPSDPEEYKRLDLGGLISFAAGVTHLRLDNFDGAAPYFEETIRLSPGFYEPVSKRGTNRC